MVAVLKIQQCLLVCLNGVCLSRGSQDPQHPFTAQDALVYLMSSLQHYSNPEI